MRLRLAAAALLVSACVTTWKYQRIEGEVASIHPELWTEVKCTGLETRKGDGGCAASLAPTVTCETSPSFCQQAPGGGAPVSCAGLEPLLSFIQLSDVKLREHALLITDDGETALPKALDQLYRTDDAVLLATVLGANQVGLSGKPLGDCPPIASPRFAIHTGNSVSVGLFSELTQFIAGMNELAIPWFNVVGPNDVAFLGSRPNEAVSGANALVPFLPIGDVDRFMRFHAQLGARKDVSLPNPDQRGQDDGPSMAGCRRDQNGGCAPDPRYPRSRFHGFNVNCERPGAGLSELENKRDTLCSAARGYYAFTVPSTRPEISFRVVVLNTSESVLDDGTSGTTEGRMLAEQVRWLKRELDALPDNTFALVFGHHPFQGFDAEAGEPLSSMLRDQPRVLGYFHGGDGDTFVTHQRARGQPLAEVGTGALLDYPQLARAIEVMRAQSGALYVRVASFSQGGTPRPLPEAKPAPVAKDCDLLVEGTSFCRRLGSRAARGFEAAHELSVDSGVTLSSSALKANGLFVVYQPDGGTP